MGIFKQFGDCEKGDTIWFLHGFTIQPKEVDMIFHKISKDLKKIDITISVKHYSQNIYSDRFETSKMGIYFTTEREAKQKLAENLKTSLEFKLNQIRLLEKEYRENNLILSKLFDLNDGDIYDIGQTINGYDKFLWLNGKWWYLTAEADENKEYLKHPNEQMSYQYSQEDLTKLVTLNEFDEVKFIRNVFELETN